MYKKTLKILFCFCLVFMLANTSFVVRRFCGQKYYDPTIEICCTGHVAQKVGDPSSCCGFASYNPRYEICCAGRVSQKVGSLPSCCGSQVFDKHVQKCAGGRVI